MVNVIAVSNIKVLEEIGRSSTVFKRQLLHSRKKIVGVKAQNMTRRNGKIYFHYSFDIYITLLFYAKNGKFYKNGNVRDLCTYILGAEADTDTADRLLYGLLLFMARIVGKCHDEDLGSAS